MRVTTPYYINKQKHNKAFIYALLILFITVFLFNTIFFRAAVKHEHNYMKNVGNCLACAYIQSMKNRFEHINTAIYDMNSNAYKNFPIINLPDKLACLKHQTLVSSKIRIDN